MKIPTYAAIFLTLSLSACVSSSIGGSATYHAANTVTAGDLRDLCLRAANAGTGTKEDNQQFYKNCLDHYDVQETKYNIIKNPTSTVPGLEEVQLEKRGSAYYVPVRINDTITLPFHLDTGADDLAIPADVALTLVRAGALRESDLIGQSSYRMANGAKEVDDVVVLREVRVGDHVIRNVRASITPAAGQLLLGQSFLSKFGAVTLDYKRRVLVLSP
jgi:predicted aspartyl protease